MAKPFSGPPVSYRDYFTQGNTRLHLVGILSGIIWNIGMGLSIIASGAAGRFSDHTGTGDLLLRARTGTSVSIVTFRSWMAPMLATGAIG